MGSVVEAPVQRAPRPVVVTRLVQLVWVLVVLAAAITVLAVVLDDEILRATASVASADDTRVPPSFTPVVIVLDVVVTSLVLVLLAFLHGGHNWARHSLAVTLVLLAVATAAMLRTGPPMAFVPPVVVWLLLDAVAVYLLYRPGTTAYVTPGR